MDQSTSKTPTKAPTKAARRTSNYLNDSPFRHTRSHTRQASRDSIEAAATVTPVPLSSEPVRGPPNAAHRGLRTSLSYYTSLSLMSLHLNSSDAKLDMLALVVTPSRSPVRAPAGPRDYYTSFFVTDGSIYPARRNVQIFRPWKAALPLTLPGDVVLLRAMGVRGYQTKKGESSVGLRSLADSAWCVWKFTASMSMDDDKPMWAKKKGPGLDIEEEEINGPPVELGGEERDEARRLRKWWVEELTQDTNQEIKNDE